MTRILFFFLFTTFSTCIISQSFWNRVDESRLKTGRNQPDIVPVKYETFSLANTDFKKYMESAPPEFSHERGQNSFLVDFPLPDGKTETFVVFQSPVMEEGLAERYPSIKSWKGYAVNDQNKVIRLDYGPNGFHGAISTNDGLVYIDPYTLGNIDNYIVYYTKDHISDLYRDRILCGADHEEHMHNDRRGTGSRSGEQEKMFLRVYRLAMACTGEWGSRRETVEKALADMVAMVNRANLIFEKELALRMVLVENNDKLIFLDPMTDPYTDADQGREILRQNTGNINTRIGSANYDIGHVLSVCFDVGGVAGGSMCTSSKGAGVTCHNNNNIESIVVRVLSHEMGHQMTASHTFNRCGETDQLALGTAFEPGSGSTIMSYAGSCGSDNLTFNNDDYFHSASLEQMLGFTNTLSTDAYNCAEKIEINNYIPELTLPYVNGFTIPISTAFELTGEAYDENGDNMTYIWEQFDNGASAPLGSPVGNSPLFRSLRPSATPTRFFPNVSRILSQNFSDVSELIPTYARSMTFRFVVRDNNPLGSAAAWQDMKFNVSDKAGPFKMIFPLYDERFRVGQKVNVKWDVAGTDQLPVDCKKVNIYLSFDSELRTGHPNLVLLAKETPNDGEETIIIPNRLSTRVRVVIKAADNIFLTTSLAHSRIEVPVGPAFFMDVEEYNQSSCLPENVEYRFSTAGFNGLDKNITFETVSGLPEGAVVTFQPSEIAPGENASMYVDLSNVTGTDVYQILVRAYVEGGDTLERTLNLSVTSTDLDNVAGIFPENGKTNTTPTQIYRWTPKTYASGYELQVATSPDFKPANMVISQNTQNPIFQSALFLEKTTIYYWRVRSYNSCGFGQWSDVNVFSTEAFNCFSVNSGPLSINISGSSTPSIESVLNVFQEGTVSNVIVKKIRGDHQRVGDLVGTLISPTGKEVLLWSRKCGTSKGFNVTIDDLAIDFFQCPINTGRIYRPESPLSQFTGEPTRGGWKIRLDDKAPGEGGRLLEFNLEFCSSVAVKNPLLILNEEIVVPYKEKRVIPSDKLKAIEDSTSDTDIVFVLVSYPQSGLILLNDIPLEPGNRFTQADINTGKLNYIHDGSEETEDYFDFVVQGKEGGWIPTNRFRIIIDQSSSTSPYENNDLNNEILVYPNPLKDHVQIRLLNKQTDPVSFTIMDLNGKVLTEFDNIQEDSSYDLSAFPDGVYLLRFRDKNRVSAKRIVKQ
ncbi:MAG: T9SS type A sorting domain-containing protein [Saprospiraceae bacterium]|nr:T9SS type A sorting domain-containing protein [Saprospiraceae bacterium]